MHTSYRYRAFLSYSRADQEWAGWLHRALESYRAPRRLVGRETPFGPVPERLAPVFRDREELASATSLGADSLEVAETRMRLAEVMSQTGRFAEAHAVAVEARRILKLSLPDDGWQAAVARNTEGAALARLGEFTRAEPLLLDSLAPLADAPIPGLHDRGRARLRDLYAAWGRPAEAAKYR